jgi:tetratricopeptide (TPR) repeat protein
LGVLGRFQGDYKFASMAYRNAKSANPIPNIGLAVAETGLSHPELAVSVARAMQRAPDRNSASLVDTSFVAIIQNLTNTELALWLGDFQTGADLAREAAARDDPLASNDVPQAATIQILGRLHDGTGMRAYWDSLPPPATRAAKAQRAIARAMAEGWLGHYRAMVNIDPETENTASAAGEDFLVRDTFERQLHPLLALAKAKTGDIAGAQALIAQSPLDCYDCVRMRGRIAQEAGQPAQADAWFARAVHDAPSIPFAYADWGMTSLARGQPDQAIAKLRLANEKGPHFADALEGWGEALMAKSQSHLALAKFAQAEKYAPSWGRMHLKWGEALFYAGKQPEAQMQFTRAATLDLTEAERSELSAMTRGGRS